MVLQNQKTNFGLILAVYLLGIFMGALDTGIITPARTIIQNNFGVDEKTGIWMITIYTLAYAVSIPIMGKLADTFGRKYIYLTSIFLFGAGSLFSGLSNNYESFTLLLIARAIQAIGGGGILPIATAEFGTTFPPEKRGLALGLVGGVFGIANIFGASAGSAIIDLFGTERWPFIFYVNIPITLFILAAGFVVLPNTRLERTQPIDFAGITVLTAMVLSLLYGLKNLNFFDFKNTLLSSGVYPFLLAFAVLLPVFVKIEKSAKDPVINLSYFTNRQILITLILAFISGFILIGLIFVPQFAENALKIKTGSGGYFVLILALFSGVGAPLSGKLIDQIGVKKVLGFGFVVSLLGALYLIALTANYPNWPNVIISLILIGLGLGFTIGTPLNYMMLDNTGRAESNSALATLSLIRSIGTAIAPAIMIGFIANAGMSVQTEVMKQLPSQIVLPQLPYTEELNQTFTQLKSDPQLGPQFAQLEIPDFSKFQTVDIKMTGESGMALPANLVNLMRTSDVTTIVDNSKTLADRLFADMTPGILEKIDGGLASGIQGIGMGLQYIPDGLPVKNQLTTSVQQMQTLQAALPGAFDTARETYVQEIENRRPLIENAFQSTLNIGFKQVYLTVLLAALLGFLLLLAYRENIRKKGPAREPATLEIKEPSAQL